MLADLFEVILGLLNSIPKKIPSRIKIPCIESSLLPQLFIFFLQKQLLWSIIPKIIEHLIYKLSNILNLCVLKSHMTFLSAVIIVYECMRLAFLNYINQFSLYINYSWSPTGDLDY